MITPFQVYLVMQLDSISDMSLLLFLLFMIAFAFTLIKKNLIEDHLADDGQELLPVKRALKIELICASIFCSICAFMPSSKTAAAMIILPAITSDKVVNTVTPELKELYSLTKDALKNLSKEAKR